MPEASNSVRNVAAFVNVAEERCTVLAHRGRLSRFKLMMREGLQRQSVDAWIEDQKRAPHRPVADEEASTNTPKSESYAGAGLVLLNTYN